MTHADWYPLPASLAPMLAAPGSPPRGRLAEWAIEMKWDGVRALAFVSDGRLRLAGLIPVSYLAFDVLQLDGRPLLALPYLERREILTTIIPNGPGRLSPPHFPGTDLDAVRAASV